MSKKDLSRKNSKSNQALKSSKTSIGSGNQTNTKSWEDDSQTPDFIYGGPFIKLEKPSPFLDTATPINLQLQGTFKKYVSHLLKLSMVLQIYQVGIL